MYTIKRHVILIASTLLPPHFIPYFTLSRNFVLVTPLAIGLFSCTPSTMHHIHPSSSPGATNVGTAMTFPEEDVEITVESTSNARQIIDSLNTCREISSLHQSKTCLKHFAQFGQYISTQRIEYYEREFARRVLTENPTLRELFSTAYQMKEQGFEDQVIFETLSIGRREHNHRLDSLYGDGLNQFSVDLEPSYFWGTPTLYTKNKVYDEYYSKAFAEYYKESLSQQDVIVSTSILAARNRQRVEFEPVVVVNKTRYLAPILYLHKEVLLSYHIVDFRNGNVFEGVFIVSKDDDVYRFPVGTFDDPGFLESYADILGAATEEYKKYERIGASVDSNLEDQLRRALGRNTEAYEQHIKNVEKVLEDLQSAKSEELTVSVWDIISHFLLQDVNDAKVDVGIEDRQGVLREISRRSSRHVDKVIKCSSDDYSRRAEISSSQGHDDIFGDADELMKRVVYIEAPNSVGSGFFVGKNLVVTNFHVVEGVLNTGAFPIVRMFRSESNRDFYGLVIGHDRRRDLAMVSVEEEGVPFSIYKGAPLQRGAVVNTFGNPRKGTIYLYQRSCGRI